MLTSSLIMHSAALCEALPSLTIWVSTLKMARGSGPCQNCQRHCRHVMALLQRAGVAGPSRTLQRHPSLHSYDYIQNWCNTMPFIVSILEHNTFFKCPTLPIASFKILLIDREPSLVFKRPYFAFLKCGILLFVHVNGLQRLKSRIPSPHTPLPPA